MACLRVVVLSSVVALSGASALAQTAAAPVIPSTSGTIAAAPSPLTSVFNIAPVAPPDSSWYVSQDVVKGIASTRDQGTTITLMPDAQQSGRTCYTMRSYRFTHEPDSNQAKPAGSSTCQSAAKFRMKDAVIVPASRR